MLCQAVMMHALDTHKAVKTLRDAGFEESQAEAVVETAVGVVAGHVASKSDLQETEVRLQAEIGYLRSDLQGLQAQTAEKFQDLYKHLWFMGAGIVAVTVALIKLL